MLRPKAEADNSIQEVHNSSYYTKAEFNIVFFIHSLLHCFNCFNLYTVCELPIFKSICLMLIKRCLFSRYYLCRNQYLSNDIVVCSCYVFEVQVAWLFFSLHLYTVICYLCIPRRCHIIIPKDTQKFMACIPQDAKNDLLIDLKMFL